MDYYACVEATANPTEDNGVPAAPGLAAPKPAGRRPAILKLATAAAAPGLRKARPTTTMSDEPGGESV